MANPNIPLQVGANLPSLDREKDLDEALEQEDQMKHLEDVLGLEPDEVEEECHRRHSYL